MSDGQIVCLIYMFLMGCISLIPAPLVLTECSNKIKTLYITWLIFWLFPPLYFLWTKGVMG